MAMMRLLVAALVAYAHGAYCHKYVMISQGRSGSEIESLAIAALTKSSDLGREVMGTEHAQMAAVKDPLKRMQEWFTKMCTENPKSYLVGFKFKPYIKVNETGFATDSKWTDVFAWLKAQNASIVHNDRNSLDLIISGAFYNASTGHSAAHCRAGDKECVAQHKNARFKVGTEELASRLRELESDRTNTLALLDRFGFRMLKVTYETLLLSKADTRLAAWKDLIAFLAPQKTFTEADLTRALQSTERTSSNHQRDRVSNYDEVVETLAKTPYAHLLHRA